MQHFVQHLLREVAKVNFDRWPNDATFQMHHLSALTKRELESSYRSYFYGDCAHFDVFCLSLCSTYINTSIANLSAYVKAARMSTFACYAHAYV